MHQLPHSHSQKRPGVPAVPGIDNTRMWQTVSQTVEFNWDTDGINFVVLTLTVPLMMHQGFLVLSSPAAAWSHGCSSRSDLWLQPQLPQAVVGLLLHQHFHSWVDRFRLLQRLRIMSCEKCLGTLGLSNLEAEGQTHCSLQLPEEGMWRRRC